MSGSRLKPKGELTHSNVIYPLPDRAGQAVGQVTVQVERLISTLGTTELSSKELMEALKLRGRDNFLRTYLYPAIEEGYVELKYPDSRNHRNQKYKLTEKGKKQL